MRLLLIHGRAQGKKNSEILSKEWVAALKEGYLKNGLEFSETIAVDVPFYGKKLDEFTQQASMPTSASVVAKGPGQDREYEQFLQSVLQEMKQNFELSDADVAQNYDGTDTAEKGIQNWAWVQALVRTIDKKFTRATDFTIETFLTDVYLYVNKPAVTRAIDTVVEKSLTSEPTIVVGHSLGSVVAYNVLCNNINNLNVVSFITVGSPLGIKMISSKLGLLKNPSPANGWYNAYDERDVVALNPLDNKYFPTTPEIVNNNSVKNQTDNRHGIAGYLNDSNIAAQIAKFLDG